MVSGVDRSSEACTTEVRFDRSPRAVVRRASTGVTVRAEERDAWLFVRLLGPREVASEAAGGAADVEVVASLAFFALRFGIFMDQLAL